MIAVEDRGVSEPGILHSPETLRAIKQAGDFFSSRSRAAQQSQHEFSREILDSPPVRHALNRLFASRCAFCNRSESSAKIELTTHHLRPPEGAVEADGTTSRRHYWWLAYHWSNLYPACSECRRAQGQKFPVDRRRARVGTSGDSLRREQALLLDPKIDNPEEFLVYLDSGEVVSRSPRGRTTIETFELNRTQLVMDRALVIEQTNWELGHLDGSMRTSEYDKALKLLTDLFDPLRPLAAQRRQRVNQWVQFRPRRIERFLWEATRGSMTLDQLAGGLRRVTDDVKKEEAWSFFGPNSEFFLRPPRLATPGPAPREARRRSRALPKAESLSRTWTYLDSAEIQAIEVCNFRAIEQIRLEVTQGPAEGSWLMLLGENGAGKSSILQAIALALSSDETVRALPADAGHLLRKGTEAGSIRIELTGKRLRELRFGKGHDGFEAGEPMDGILVAGYGATRLMPRSRDLPAANSKVESLFDPFVPLSRPSSWLPDLDKEQFDAVARALKRLLNLDAEETMTLIDGDIHLVDGKRRLRMADLSDGYQAMAGFGLDMMELFLRRWGSLEAAEGIVLVDELGAHLHPRWQMQVTGLLRAAFPRVQFIATTHDPLCLQGLHNGEVAVLRRKGNQVYALHGELPPVEGLAVDQILTSEHFGLNSSRAPEIEDLLNEYYELIADRERDEQGDRRLEVLIERLDGYRLLGSTLRERLALGAADEFIARQRGVQSAEEFSDLRDATKQRIKAIWKGTLR
jgi:uncharacterized protein (TIGR02646 family)